MKYPEGQFVSVGDHVWWDGGAGTGYIIAVFEEQSEYEDVSLEGPGVFISFDGSKNWNDCLYVGYLRSSFEEDGIGLVSAEEEKEIQKVLISANNFNDNKKRDFQSGVFSTYSEGSRLYWEVIFYSEKIPICNVLVDPINFECRKGELRSKVQ